MYPFAPKRIFDDQTNDGEPVCRQSFPANSSHATRSAGRCRSASSSSTDTTSPLEPDDVADSSFDSSVLRAHSFDEILFDIRKVSADKIAAQLTLIDLPLFKAIRMEELNNCNWTKKDKLSLAPNIVAFTKRFNHTSFWVIREILNEEHLRARAEILTQFIKISKKLLDLNNIHSLKAVMAGLQSGPIFRLTQTWKLVSKKDKATFEKLETFLSSDENWTNLRSHLDAANLPCIPYLGLYLTDLAFVNSLQLKHVKENLTRNMIVYFQSSTYESLAPQLHIRKYLLHTHYIDELEKFFEDDNYKLSLQREPDPVSLRKQRSNSIINNSAPPATSKLRSSKSHEDLLTPFFKTKVSVSVGSWSHTRSPLSGTQDSLPSQSGSKIKLTSHDFQAKKNSLPQEFRKLSLSLMKNQRLQLEPTNQVPVDLLTPSESVPCGVTVAEGRASPLPLMKKFSRGHKKAQSLGSNVLSMLGISKHSQSTSTADSGSPSSSPYCSQSFLHVDDLMFDTSATSSSVGNLSMSTTSSEDSGTAGQDDQLYKKLDGIDDLEVDYVQAQLIMEGPLKRKVLVRHGKTVSQLRRRSKAWVQLTDNSLLLLPLKPKKKKQNKSMCIKGLQLKGWGVKHGNSMGDSSDKAHCKNFILYSEDGNVIRFTAKSATTVETWMDKISMVIHLMSEREKCEAEESLIKL